MRRVQDYFAGQLQSIDESNQMVVSEPTFVELVTEVAAVLLILGYLFIEVHPCNTLVPYGDDHKM